MDAREITFRIGGILALSLAAVFCGCHSTGKASSSANATHHSIAATKPATTRRVATSHPTTVPTILDVRRGTGSFPLLGEPSNAHALQTALVQGYLKRLTPATQNFVTVTGEVPHLKSLHVDVSGAKVHPDYQPKRFDKQITGDAKLAVDDLDYAAHPLDYEDMKMDVHLAAKNATMEILHDSSNRRGLVLTGAQKGRMDFAISRADSQGLLSVTSRKGGGGFGVEMDETKLSFSSDSPHTLQAAVHVKARWLILPMTFRVHGKISVTDDGTVTYSEIGADGEDPGGDLAASFISPYVKKMNGTTQRLVAFSDEKTHVTAVRFDTSEGIAMSVEFGQD